MKIEKKIEVLFTISSLLLSSHSSWQKQYTLICAFTRAFCFAQFTNFSDLCQWLNSIFFVFCHYFICHISFILPITTILSRANSSIFSFLYLLCILIYQYPKNLTNTPSLCINPFNTRLYVMFYKKTQNPPKKGSQDFPGEFFSVYLSWKMLLA